MMGNPISYRLLNENEKLEYIITFLTNLCLQSGWVRVIAFFLIIPRLAEIIPPEEPLKTQGRANNLKIN